MNYNQILHKIESYSLTIPYVHSVNLGDIYEYLNGNPDVKYACVNIDITESTRNDNLTSYVVYLYYVDRLTQDKSNVNEIKTTAEQVLNSIVNYAAQIGDVNDGWTIHFFEQQFADYCAGGYVQFNLEVPNLLGDCLIDKYIENDTAFGFLYIVVGFLQETHEDILHVFSHIAGFGQRGSIRDRERYLQHLGDGSCEQGFARSG